MPCFVQKLTPQGLQDVDYVGESLEDTVRYEPSDGVYTVSNTFHRTQVLKFDAHLDRLEDSARRADIPLTLDRQRLRQALRHMIERVAWGDVRFRITVSKSDPSTLILSLEPFKPLDEKLLTQGTHCITAANSARHDPETKATAWMHTRKALQNAMPPNIYDTFLCDAEGYILEGLASNFYAVLDNTLWTAERGVLKGISRQIVLEVAQGILSVRLEPVHISQLAQLQEAFLSSSSRGIVPVVSINGIAIGDGKVGAHTRALRQAYTNWLHAHLEEL